MGLETFGFIDSLNASNPVGASDPKSQGDDHIRGLKSTLLASFPSITGAVTATQAELNILDGVTKTTAEINDLVELSSAQTISAVKTFTANPVVEHAAASAIGARFTASGASGYPEVRLSRTAGTTSDWEIYLPTGSTDLRMYSGSDLFTFGTSGDMAATSVTLTGDLTANQALLNGSSVRNSAAIVIDSAQHAAIYFKPDPTGSPADSSNWAFDVIDNGAAASYIRIGTATDADAVGSQAIQIFRSGTTITEIQFDATTLDVNAAVDINSTLVTGGSITVNSNTVQIGASGSGTGGAVRLTDDSGTSRWLMGILGVASATSWSLYNLNGSDEKLTVNNAGDFNFHSGSVTTDNDSANEVGYKGMPIASTSSNLTLALSECGGFVRCFSHTGITVTIPANSSVAYPVGTVITIVNDDSADNVTIAITTDTLQWASGGSTGSRTLAPFGVATILKITSTAWVISGVGLS